MMNPFNQFGRSRHRFVLNEKSLVLLLIFVSVITIFIILFNLPNELTPHVSINRDDIKKVLIPDLKPPPQNKQLPNIHNDDHQHPAPPMFEKEKNNPDRVDQKLSEGGQDGGLVEGVEEKRERIRKVSQVVLHLSFNCKFADFSI